MRTHIIKQVSEVAFEDITKYLKSKILPLQRGKYNNWVVTPWHLNTKEVRRLNKELGINGVNHEGNINWINSHKRYKN